MKKKVLIALAIMAGITSIAQEGIIILHPVIGDSISQKDKTDFLLFPEINDNDFVFGHIFKKELSYHLEYLDINNQHISISIDSIELLQYHLNVHKLNEYYSSLDRNDSIYKLSDIMISPADLDINKLNIQLIDPQLMEKLPYESRRVQMLKNSGLDNGLWGKDLDNYIQTSGYIEFFHSK